MNLALLKLFVKDINDKSPENKRKCGTAAGIVGIISNVILFVAKLAIGLLTSSISIIADAANNIFDAGSSVITLIGFKISEKPADDKHPYGHARVEYLTGFIVSLIITVVGLQFLGESVSVIFNPVETKHSLVSIIVLIIAIVGKLWQATFYTRVGKHIGSTSLLATAADSRNDTIITISVLIGAIVNKFTNVVLDGYLGVLIALFIIYSGIKLVLETADPILGVPPSRETIREIGEKILSYDGIIGIHDLIVHNYGEGRCFASVHCEVPASEDVLKSHDIIDNIEFDFLREMGISLVIHMDPVVTDDENANRLRENVNEIIFGLARELDEEISMHDFRVVVGQTHTNLIFDVVLNYSCKADEKDVVASIEREIKKLSPDYNAVINVDRSFVSGKE